MREKISKIFTEVFLKQYPGVKLPALTDDLVLLESGLDSLGFAVLVLELEMQLGFDPFTSSKESYYPSTFAEFVSFYEKFEP